MKRKKRKTFPDSGDRSTVIISEYKVMFLCIAKCEVLQ